MILLLAGAQAAAFRHALLIVADDLGTDKVGAYAADVTNPDEDRPLTPRIDLLADAGVRFSQAWGAPACSPARALLYSGEYGYHNRVGEVIGDDDGARLATDPPTLQRHAQAAGLGTALLGKWHLGTTDRSPIGPIAPYDHPEFVVTTGFDEYRGGMPESYLDWLYVVSAPDAQMSSGYATSASRVTTSATERTTADALAFMQARVAAGERHLTVVSYQMPHATRALDGAGTSWEDAARSCGVTPTGDDPTDFRAAVECLDGAVGALLDAAPELDRTLVVFVGDNGTPLEAAEGAFADDRGKSTVYESGVRVPFVLVDGAALAGATPAEPVIRSGVVSDAPTGLVDLYATVVELLAIDVGACAPGVDCARDSVSLAAHLAGGAAPRDTIWTEQFFNTDEGVRGAGALRSGDLKLVVHTDAAGFCRAYELYDLAVDRWEQDDLARDPAYADALDAMLAELAVHADAMAGTPGDWLGVPDCCTDTEVWYDGVDGDCDGASDFDQDADGHDVGDGPRADCDDTDPDVYPGAFEVWYDGVDANCDGRSDADADADGHDAAEHGGDDCDDTRREVFPGAPDRKVDGLDTNCDGVDGPHAPPRGAADCGCVSGASGASSTLLGAAVALLARRRRRSA